MKSSDLDRIKRWFASYVAGFAAPDGSLHNIYLIKRDHSLRVGANCLAIAGALGWEGGRIAAAEALGLLHDVGRFPQFQRFHTLEDAKSVNHGELGRGIVSDFDLLSSSNTGERDAILCSICHHNSRELADGCGPESLAFLKLIRDADKLDIIRVVSDIIRTGNFSKHPELLLNVDPDGPASPEMIEAVTCRRSGSYKNVRSLADMNLMRLSWVYDLNYPPTFRFFAERELLEEIRGMMPATPEIHRIIETARSYVMERSEFPCPAAAPRPVVSCTGEKGTK